VPRNAPLGDAQPLAVQASQQLAWTPTHAAPPFGGLQLAALDFVEHVVAPFFVVRQHVTNPALPHVDRAAHLTTTPLQLLFVSVAFACFAAHLTNWPWLGAPAQSQFAATAARAAATSLASAPVGSHFAVLRCAVNASSDNAITVTK
jgi:hypothetical protein